MRDVRKKAELIQSLEATQRELALAGFHKDAIHLGKQIASRKNFVAASYLGIAAEDLGSGSAPKAIRALVCEIATVAAIKDAHEIKDMLVTALIEGADNEDAIVGSLLKTKTLVDNS